MYEYLAPGLVYGVFFVLAVGADYLSCLWHRSRERNQKVRGMLYAMCLEALGWIPIWFALTLADVWIAVVSIAGSAVGSYTGFGREPDELEELRYRVRELEKLLPKARVLK